MNAVGQWKCSGDRVKSSLSDRVKRQTTLYWSIILVRISLYAYAEDADVRQEGWMVKKEEDNQVRPRV